MQSEFELSGFKRFKLEINNKNISQENSKYLEIK